MKKLVVTGGAGFIGSHFLRRVLSDDIWSDYQVHNLDILTYAGNLITLSDIDQNPRYHFHKLDIRDQVMIDRCFQELKPDACVNFAAESHVDRSIDNSNVFLETNILGANNLANSMCVHGSGDKRFLQVSTDEVYGDLNLKDPAFTEKTPLKPSSPYSSSKTAADLLIQAFGRTHGLNYIITRCSNNYGSYQYPEKLIPVVIDRLMNNQKIPVYGNGQNQRDWIHVEDHCRGIESAFFSSYSSEVFNFGGETELSNIELVKSILQIMNKNENQIEFVKDRAGHDFRYAVDFTKASQKLNWKPAQNFSSGLEQVVEWYQKNSQWVTEVRTT
ncbi:MAG: dTDP-glucose 4,6-dehydratase [Bdellovibrionales bacterium]